MDAAARPVTATLVTELGGQVLLGGVYDTQNGELGLTGTLTLDAAGNADTV